MAETTGLRLRKIGDIRLKDGKSAAFSVNSDTNLTVFDISAELYEGKIAFAVANTGAQSVDITIQGTYEIGNGFTATATDIIPIETATALAAGATEEFTMPPLSAFKWIRLSLKRTGAGLSSTCDVWVTAAGRS